MAIKENGTSGGRDAAYRRSGSTTKVHNDLYDGRTTDADLASSDGKPLEERDEWAMDKVNRRGQWKAPEW